MIFWLLDIMTWWAWGQAMTMIDGDLHAGHPAGEPLDRSLPILFLNLGMIVCMIGIFMALHVLGNELIDTNLPRPINPAKRIMAAKLGKFATADAHKDPASNVELRAAGEEKST